MNTPPNGYYIARVQYDTGGTLPTYVHVNDGVIRANDGSELRAEACSEFAEIGTLSFCAVWPDQAAKELDALRSAHTRLTLIAECLAADLRAVKPTAESIKAYDQLKT